MATPNPPFRRVTLQDIARETGLSRETVGSVLGGRAHLFREETRRLVESAARKLNYRPNGSARAMRTGRFNSLALLLSERGPRSSLLPGFLDGVETAAADHEQHLLLARLPDSKLVNPGFVPKFLREYMADGVLVNYFQEVPAAMDSLLASHGIPCVWTNIRRKHDCIHPDDREAAARLTSELINRGHRRITYVDLVHSFDPKADHYSAFDRLEGYRAVMETNGLAVSTLCSGRRIENDEAAAMIGNHLDTTDRPTAIIAYGDREANLTCRAALTKGIQPGKGLAVALFTALQPADLVYPFLSMHIPAITLGRSAVELLVRKIADPKTKLAPVALPLRFSAESV